MNSIKFRSIINFSTAVCLVVAASVAFWGWTTSGQIASQSIQSDSLRSNQSALTQPPTESLQLGATAKVLVDSQVWRRSLQSGFRAKAVAPKVETRTALPPPPTPPLNEGLVTTDLGLRLVGTVIEKGRSMAIAVDRLGKLDFCSEGAELQLEPPGIRIDSIATDSISVSYQGKTMSWLMGQSLRIDGTTNQTESILLMSPTPKEQSPTKPKMSIEDELELINGSGVPIPL